MSNRRASRGSSYVYKDTSRDSVYMSGSMTSGRVDEADVLEISRAEYQARHAFNELPSVELFAYDGGDRDIGSESKGMSSKDFGSSDNNAQSVRYLDVTPTDSRAHDELCASSLSLEVNLGEEMGILRPRVDKVRIERRAWEAGAIRIDGNVDSERSTMIIEMTV
ncbi:hypothetical protein SISSUDRAFT_127657 [Sistotremastrum suecicum HHB10207 ss-3]|uniref:Uncharacterized protein n=1 Tax=Sistotremastrum suecicum HHB10207 ss-3 TaxID=1314776 RepID=A0A166AY79_9AGAM|nr:hypothetical protein SISSUDRAFT_127657 [Sistotremastrum suecicum HHB10207 ss-3]